jgi:hypothetical protein
MQVAKRTECCEYGPCFAITIKISNGRKKKISLDTQKKLSEVEVKIIEKSSKLGAVGSVVGRDGSHTFGQLSKP